MEFVVKKYHFEPSQAIWRLQIPSLNIIVQCIETSERNFGNLAEDSTISGDLILMKADVRLAKDPNVAPLFSIIDESFDLSDGSVIHCVGTVKEIEADNKKFKLSSTIDVFVKAETSPHLSEGDTVKLVGVLLFKPN